MDRAIDVSIVGPVYKGGKTLRVYLECIKDVMAYRNQAFEIILVDDGCPDDSWNIIQYECSRDKSVKGVRLSRNFGQQIAVSAGLRFASGKFVILMDTDLQNPPNAIPVILDRLEAGTDIVYTTSKVRNNWFDEVTSSLFWFIINNVLKVQMVPNQLMMKGLSREFLTVYNSYDERVRVVAGITHDIGMKNDVIEVDNMRRKSGRSGHDLLKRINLMIDVVLAVSSKPLNLLIYISIFTIFGSLGLGLYTLIVYLVSPNIPSGYPTLLSIIIFFGSMTLFVLGIIGRYLANIYVEVRHRPLFISRSKINL